MSEGKGSPNSARMDRRQFLVQTAVAVAAGALAGAGAGTFVASQASGAGSLASKREADIIVVGGGGAGLMAAIVAADKGARVLQFDKESLLGGAFRVSGGTSTGAMTRIQLDSGVFEDSPALFYKDVMRLLPMWMPKGDIDPQVVMFYCEHAGEAVDWLDSLGTYLPEQRVPRYGVHSDNWTVDRSYYVGSGKVFLDTLLREHQKRVDRGDITLLLSTQVTELLQDPGDGGRIVGVRAAGKGSAAKEYRAGAVIVCTGGFGHNKEWLRKYGIDPDQVNLLSPLSSSGDGHTLCEQVGAKLINMGAGAFPNPGCIPDPSKPGRVLAYVNMGYGVHPGEGGPYPGAIWVGPDGSRVVNEDCGQFKVEELVLHRQTPLTVILDKKIMQENESILTGWFSIPPRTWEWFEEKANEGVVIKKADTVEQLAGMLSMDAPTLRQTIDKYNGHVAAGVDAEFGRKDLRYALENPPFYAIPTTVAFFIFMTNGGPANNVQQQVLDANGRVIPGLYVAGELAGHQAVGTGSMNIGNLVFGKQAAEMAALETL